MMEDEKLDRVFDEFFIGKFEEKDEIKEKGDLINEKSLSN